MVVKSIVYLFERRKTMISEEKSQIPEEPQETVSEESQEVVYEESQETPLEEHEETQVEVEETWKKLVFLAGGSQLRIWLPLYYHRTKTEQQKRGPILVLRIPPMATLAFYL
jgi:hypothetical protein